MIDLREIKKMDVLINSKLLELERLKELLTKVNVASYEDRVQTSHMGNGWEDTIQKIIDIEQEINREIDRFVDYKKECQKVIDQLDDVNLIELAYKRYFEYKTFESIADEMHYSINWVFVLHRKLLKIVYKS